uniref:Uncharacterized protein n=1 Tax=viral metagenome TaxID=1070528 RepID=A0A6H1ZUD8_9ZZZZ
MKEESTSPFQAQNSIGYSHICSEITCGKCGCKYCSNCYSGCPQCGFGRPVTTTTDNTSITINQDEV